MKHTQVPDTDSSLQVDVDVDISGIFSANLRTEWKHLHNPITPNFSFFSELFIVHHKLRPQISTRSQPCYKTTSSGLQAAAVVSNLGALTFPGHSSNASPNSPGISSPGGASPTRTCHLLSLKKSLHPSWASLSSKDNGKNEARGGWRDQQ